MAYGKDIWAIDPGKKLAAFTTGRIDFNSRYALPAQPSYDYTPATPHDFSLTEALDKPLYEFSEGELHDLVSELKMVRWAEKEQQVREVVRNFMMQYQSLGSPSAVYQKNVKHITLELPVRGYRSIPAPPQNSGGMVPSTVYSTQNKIRISIPTSIPSEYVHAFVERMVRDAFEEA